jgi:type IV pilus assembly protein PilN
VILINLLPHREERRKRRKTAFFVGLGLAAAMGIGISTLWYGGVQQMISSQQDRNAFLESENKKLDNQIRDIASLRSEIEALKSRQKAVEDLQTDRNIPVHLLNDLAKQVPEGVYLSSIKQAGNVVTIAGVAQTNERVSELLRNTSHSAAWLEKPELVEIKSTLPSSPNAQQRRLYDFSMRLNIKRPVAVNPADMAATKPAPAASLAAANKAVTKAP